MVIKKSVVLFITLIVGLFLHDANSLSQTVDEPDIIITPVLLNADGEPYPVYESPATIPLELLGAEDNIIEGPSGRALYTFGLPAEWELQPGAMLQLNITAFSDISEAALDSNGDFAGILRVEFNRQFLDIAPINWLGERTITIPITDAALITDRGDGRHQLSLEFESRFPCDSGRQSGIIISSNSTLNLPFEIILPELDIRNLPYPFLQQSFLPDTALLIIPDAPTQEELEAAMLTMAGMSKLTSGRLTLSLVPINQLTSDYQEASHLIFVGRASEFPMFEEITLPLSWSNQGFSITERGSEDDGILQLAESPWNSTKAILIVSGQSGSGVIKASKALSTGQIRANETHNLAFINNVDEETITSPQSSLLTFTSLGYETITVDDMNEMSGDNFYFSITDLDSIGPNATFNLVYSHSNAIDYEQSGIVVRLNTRPIGSIQFSEETVNTINLSQIQIPNAALAYGNNELKIDTFLFSADPCADPNTNTIPIWVTIHADSYLNLPVVESSILEDSAELSSVIYDLDNYPNMFIRTSDLSDLAFVLPQDDMVAWTLAAKVAAEIGRRALNSPIQIKTFIDGYEFSEDELQTYRFIILGNATQMSFMNQLSDILPVPFREGSNIVDESTLPVFYNYTEEQHVGYIQLANSPWNNQLPLLVAAGTSEQGLIWAGNALSTSLRNQLEGNFATVEDEQIVHYNLRREFLVSQTPHLTSDSDSTADIELQPEQLPIEVQRPSWLLPLIIGSGILTGIITLGVIIGIAIRFIHRRRTG